MNASVVHPFSVPFEHPADADCVPTARCGKKTFPTYVHYLYQLFRISLCVGFHSVAVAVLQTEIEDVWRR